MSPLGGVVHDRTCAFLVVDVKGDGNEIAEMKSTIESANSTISDIKGNINSMIAFDSAEIEKEDILLGSDWETEFNGSNYIGSGDKTLAHPYTDYDVLLFLYVGASYDCYISVVPVWLLKRNFDTFKKTTPYNRMPSYVYIWGDSSIGARCWTTNIAECTDSFWKAFASNTHLFSVIGVKFKGGKKYG